MAESPKFPAWLTFVDRVPDEKPLLRLMVLNPINDAVSTYINEMIDVDSETLLPRPADLRVARS